MIDTARSVAPEKRPVVVTCSSELTTRVDDLGIFGDAVKVVVSTEAIPNWTSFEALMSPQAPSAEDGEVNSQGKIIEGLVVFTSGTTSKPKGCFTQYPMLTHVFETDAMMALDDKLCCVVPNNHAMGHLTCSICHTGGTALIYPGPGFQADAVMQTLLREKVTQVRKLLPRPIRSMDHLESWVGTRAQGGAMEYLLTSCSFPVRNHTTMEPEMQYFSCT